jgi:hypothetical protein
MRQGLTLTLFKGVSDMIKHDAIRSVCKENYSPRMLRERLIVIAAFSLIGVSLFLSSL